MEDDTKKSTPPLNPELRTDLEQMQETLEDIAEGESLYKTIGRGALQGVGLVVGTVLAVALLGWLLSFSGIIPGFDDLAQRLKDILQNRY